jgi:hypothetical protein
MMHGFVDFDCTRDANGRKSTSEFYFSLGSCMISWFNKKQAVVALRLIKEEDMVANATSCEVIWLRKLIVELIY